MRFFVLTATYELRISRKSHLRDHPSSRGRIDPCPVPFLTHVITNSVPSKGQCHKIFCFWFFSWICFPTWTHFFLLQMGDRTDKVYTPSLKPARTPNPQTRSWHSRHAGGRPAAHAPTSRTQSPSRRRPECQGKVTFQLQPASSRPTCASLPQPVSLSPQSLGPAVACLLFLPAVT
jgi:hypothetical protein